MMLACEVVEERLNKYLVGEEELASRMIKALKMDVSMGMLKQEQLK
jgi:hypothetical protein